MLWTYTGDPEDSPKDAVRFLLGDTDPGDKQLWLHEAIIETKFDFDTIPATIALSEAEMDLIMLEWLPRIRADRPCSRNRMGLPSGSVKRLPATSI